MSWRSIIALILGVSAVLAASLGVARATDQPAFCTAACHEMGPYHDAWAQGPHASVSCIECHVDPGTVPRLAHKAVALKEVWVHFTKQPAFPLEQPSKVPDERCLSCHTAESANSPGFDHVDHATRGSCQDCHADGGHKVTAAALASAGVLSGETTQVATGGTEIARVNAGNANVEGHTPISCSRCHDLEKTGCATCHEQRHDDVSARTAGDCTACHSPGTSFDFEHPAVKDGCTSCHDAPSEHDYSQDCSTCHRAVGSKWSFSHPADKSCSNCHKKPAKHRSGACSSCHSAGKSWEFKHPGGGSSCTTCHDRPAKHRSGACSKCHSAGKSWAFKHPGGSSSCSACHTRPAKHRSGACSSCHRAGGSWAFRHTGSSKCASCHKAPSSHYGSSCASCHRSTRSWAASAAVKHPRIRGGEHSSKSFKCASCHPKGYASATCSKCHKSANGPSDDDDDDDD